MADERKRFDFELRVTGNCPCGKEVQIGMAFGEGFPTDGGSVILHPIPFCKPYQDKEMLEYIRYLRQHMEAQRGKFNA